MANKRGVYAPVCAPSFCSFKLFHEKNDYVHE